MLLEEFDENKTAFINPKDILKSKKYESAYDFGRRI